jgi:DNA-binding transcriptional LysR family regulator
MVEQLEALRALQQAGTMGRAAAILRLTQSAISKRIAALEERVGVPLVEPQGRRVRLTPDGERLLADARPLLTQLAEVLRARSPARDTTLRLAATESLLSSWLPACLRAASEASGVRLELHAHRGPVLLERIRSGDYAVGVCPAPIAEGELDVRVVGEEPLVVVPGRPNVELVGRVPVWAIETHSLTWDAVAPRLARAERKGGFELAIEERMESFSALVQVARAGFANALVPIGVARGLGVDEAGWIVVPGVARPVAVVGRRTALDRPAVVAWMAALKAELPAFLS